MDRRRVGRPAIREGEKSVYVTFALPIGEYDSIYQKAKRDRRTVPEHIRRKLRDEDDVDE